MQGDAIVFNLAYGTLLTRGYHYRVDGDFTNKQLNYILRVLLYSVGFTCESISFKSWDTTLVEFMMVEPVRR